MATSPPSAVTITPSRSSLNLTNFLLLSPPILAPQQLSPPAPSLLPSNLFPFRHKNTFTKAVQPSPLGTPTGNQNLPSLEDFFLPSPPSSTEGLNRIALPSVRTQAPFLTDGLILWHCISFQELILILRYSSGFFVINWALPSVTATTDARRRSCFAGSYWHLTKLVAFSEFVDILYSWMPSPSWSDSCSAKYTHPLVCSLALHPSVGAVGIQLRTGSPLRRLDTLRWFLVDHCCGDTTLCDCQKPTLAVASPRGRTGRVHSWTIAASPTFGSLYRTHFRTSCDALTHHPSPSFLGSAPTFNTDQQGYGQCLGYPGSTAAVLSDLYAGSFSHMEMVVDRAAEQSQMYKQLMLLDLQALQSLDDT